MRRTAALIAALVACDGGADTATEGTPDVALVDTAAPASDAAQETDAPGGAPDVAALPDTATSPDVAAPEGGGHPPIDVTAGPGPDAGNDAGTPPPPDVVDASSAPDITTPLVLPPGLNGQPAPAPTPLPAVTGVIDTTNSPVDTSVLLGQWTVMWFYPAASTAG